MTDGRAHASVSAMSKGSAAVDHAFALARTGKHRSVAAVLRELDDEERTAVEAHLATPNARRELIMVCADAWLATR